MALGQIHKGVRELIRVTMRERGIKHRSTKDEICSICYAQQPTMTVEYEGPVFVTYDEPIVHVLVYGYSQRGERLPGQDHLSGRTRLRLYRRPPLFRVFIPQKRPGKCHILRLPQIPKGRVYYRKNRNRHP